ncbi:CidA/LrgA family protein [Marinospirillum perlucidum]|uniref:CidA/LrgA family protein n=1 Tax=Marinospirillum perlucidum TaxID=1982602 RepID=UPI000DF4444E|nr:CidA/LrgA family protein [Marinospirillum perlucidum]
MWGLLLLVLLQMLGSLINAAGLALPGPVIGMLLLLGLLLLLGRVPEPLQVTSSQLLKYLPLMLIPPAVGILSQWQVITSSFLAISVALLGSLLISIPLTAWLLQRLVKRKAVSQ